MTDSECTRELGIVRLKLEHTEKQVLQWMDLCNLHLETLRKRDLEIAELKTKVAETEGKLNGWRQWVQFVWKGGGPVVGSDEVLRSKVCHEFDALHARLTEAQATIEALTNERDETLNACDKRCNSLETMNATREAETIEECCKAVCPYCNDPGWPQALNGQHTSPITMHEFQCKAWRIRLHFEEAHATLTDGKEKG